MKRNDKQIIIKCQSTFNASDISLFSLLYGPLLDSDSFKLYLTLVSLILKENKNESFTELALEDLLGFTEKKFITSRNKLEALDLIITYESNENYLIVLHKPSNAKQFFTNGVLGSYLNNKIGESNLRNVVDIFKVPSTNLDEYKNISKTFDSVFTDIEIDKKIEIKDDLEVDVYANNINLENSNFDYEEFSKEVDLSPIPYNMRDKFKQNVLNDAHMYSLSLTDIVLAYNKASSYNDFNFKVFRTYLKKIYNETNTKKVLAYKQINNDELYKDLENITTPELLSNLGLDNNALNVAKISEIYNEIKLERASVNLLILYVVKKNKELSSINYFISIYNTLVEKGMLSFNEIKSYLFDNNKSNKKNNKNSPETNEWVDKNMDDFLGGLEDGNK